MHQIVNQEPAVNVIKDDRTGDSGDAPDQELVRNIWEMDSMFVCPMIGACLTLAEQKRVLKKTSVKYEGRDAYDLHELFVSMSDTDNKLSRRVNRLLQRKYLPRLVDLPILPEEDFLKAWRKCFDEGSLDLAIYAAASRKDLSLDSKAELFGTIHMSMHETSGTVAKLKKELIRAGEAARAAEGKNRGLTLAYRELKKEAGELKEALEKQRLKTAHARMKSEAASPELASPAPGTPAGDQDNGPGQDGEREADERLEICRLKRELINLRKRTRRLEDRLVREKQQHLAALQQLQAFYKGTAEIKHCDASCPSYDLCQKRILIVGGITKMEAHYRKVVESQGGCFEYHDGNLRSGARTLESRFKRADLVLCPVDCNSHAACIVVKKLGKKHNKPVRMLFGSSLNAISQALTYDNIKSTEAVR